MFDNIGIGTGNYARMQGCKRSTIDPPRFSSYRPQRFGADELPEAVDLRDDLSPIEDQSAVSSCTANAIAGAYEYLAMREFGESGDVSRLFIYYNARYMLGEQDQDCGSSIAAAIAALEQAGACSEATWPYEPDMVLEEPPAEAYEEAQDFCVESAQKIAIDLFSMKHCLATGYPFVFGLSLFQSFDAMDAGYVPMPSEEETGRSSHGAHAMICVGYNDEEEVFIVRNSWGEDWGDDGYCYIPYAYMGDPELCWDCWAIQAVSDLDYEAEGLDQEELEDEEVEEGEELEESDEESEESDEEDDEELEESDEEDEEPAESEDDEELEDDEADEDEELYEDEDFYIVQEGDTLYDIADRVYGDGELWPDLYEANLEAIGDDPNYIQVGMELFLPDL